jgi:hypothetical protein
MARAFQAMNAKSKYSRFIQKTNGCTEHAIILNELMHDANRNRKNLVMTAIDFSNAFGSVPYEMIMSVMEQRNFPEWSREIVGDMYEGATSVIELKGKRSRQIEWKRGVKQGCPLSPLLFNLCVEAVIEGVVVGQSQKMRGMDQED